MGPSRLLKVPDAEASCAGRRRPMDVTWIIARGVVAHRMERDVRGGQLRGHDTFGVTVEPRRIEWDTDDLRMHIEVDLVLPSAARRCEAERIAAHRPGGAQGHDTASGGRNTERFDECFPGVERRNDERKNSLPHGQLNDIRASSTGRVIGHADLAE